MKFHIGKNGPAKCAATKRACPVGGDHFESMTEAVKTYEQSQSVNPLWMQPHSKKHKFALDYTSAFPSNLTPSEDFKTFARDFRTRIGRDVLVKLEAANLTLNPYNTLSFDVRIAGIKPTGERAPRLTDARVEIRPNLADDTYTLDVFERGSLKLKRVQSSSVAGLDRLDAVVRAL